jgi:hypothetical protein
VLASEKFDPEFSKIKCVKAQLAQHVEWDAA